MLIRKIKNPPHIYVLVVVMNSMRMITCYASC